LEAEQLAHADLESERRRREWAEKLAQTGLDVGEDQMSRALEIEGLLRDLLSRVEAHGTAALEADMVRSGDSRLYRHASRIRAALEQIEEPTPPAAVAESFEEPAQEAVEAPEPDRVPVERRNGRKLLREGQPAHLPRQRTTAAAALNGDTPPSVEPRPDGGDDGTEFPTLL
jgi:hypothetical protein